MYELQPPPEMFLAESGSYRPLCSVDDAYVAGEAVTRWFHREQSRRLRDLHESEMLMFDAELAELLFRMKQKLSQLGRNGGWSLWLRQQKIQRSTADRLVIQYASSYGLTDELRHRDIAAPLEANVCLAANRTSKRLKNMLNTPRSRMAFVGTLANLFQLIVDWESGVESVRVSIPPPVDESDLSSCRVPNVFELNGDKFVPVDYELKTAEDDERTRA